MPVVRVAVLSAKRERHTQHWPDSGSPDEVHGNGDGDGDRDGDSPNGSINRSRHGRYRARRNVPGRNDERSWIRIPAVFLHSLITQPQIRYAITAPVIIPLAILSGYLDWAPRVAFALNYVAILLLSLILDSAIEDLCFQNPAYARSANYLICNPVILILSIVAGFKGEDEFVPILFTGSVLFNLLFLLGIGLLASGFRGGEQPFASMPANSFAHILVVGVSALSIPALLSGTSLDLGVDVPPKQLVFLARGIAVVMMVLYACYIFFSGWTHHYLYDDDDDSTRELLDDGEEQARPQTAIVLFTLAIALLAISSGYAIDALADLTNPLHTSQKLIIFLFFPLLSHPADILHCVELAVAGEIDLFLNLVLENSAGTVAYLNPLFVISGWAFRKPFLVNFEGIQLLALLMAAFLTSSYTFADGKGNWLKGWTLIAMYLMFALAFVLLLKDQ